MSEHTWRIPDELRATSCISRGSSGLCHLDSFAIPHGVSTASAGRAAGLCELADIRKTFKTASGEPRSIAFNDRYEVHFLSGGAEQVVFDGVITRTRRPLENFRQRLRALGTRHGGLASGVIAGYEL